MHLVRSLNSETHGLPIIFYSFTSSFPSCSAVATLLVTYRRVRT